MPNFCEQTASIWGAIGWLVFILKIVIPLLLIVFGMLDLGKAVIASDDKAINKAINTLLHRFIAAIAVFFVPSIVVGLFNAVTGFDVSKGKDSPYGKCVRCLLDVTGENNNGTGCKSDVSVSAPVEKTSNGGSGNSGAASNTGIGGNKVAEAN